MSDECCPRGGPAEISIVLEQGNWPLRLLELAAPYRGLEPNHARVLVLKEP